MRSFKRSTKRGFAILLLLAVAVLAFCSMKQYECCDSCVGHDWGRFHLQEWRCYCVDETPLVFGGNKG